MTRLKALDPDQSTGKAKDLFNGVKSKLGMVPNMMRTMGNSPAFLQGYLQLGEALSGGALGARTGELIALTVAQINECDYCLSAHMYLGKNVYKMDAEMLEAARSAEASDLKTNAILHFAKILVIKKGKPSSEDLNAVLSAGISEAQVVEIVGHVALNVLTNYLNNTAQTEIDFPVVESFSVASV